MIRLFVILFFISFPLCSQKSSEKIKVKKLPVDTIDYVYMNSVKGYTLHKVVGKSGDLKNNCSKILMFRVGINADLSDYYSGVYTNRFRAGDTVMSMAWYMPDNINCLGQKCDVWNLIRFTKIRLNKNSNVLTMEKYPCESDKTAGKFLFKVIKFSEYEIILQDLQKSIEKYYYFRKN